MIGFNWTSLIQVTDVVLPAHLFFHVQKPHTQGSGKYVNPFSATRSDSRHQNKVKIKGLGGNSSYLAGFSIFHGSVNKFNQLAEKNYLEFISLA